MCNLYFNTTSYTGGQTVQKFVSTSCKCALDGDNGFCGNILGTELYFEGLSTLKNILQSSECHTLDRFDLRAQKDCGIGPGDEWETAVNWQFKLNYWPYVNAESESVRQCVEDMFLDSLTNLKKDGAVHLLLSTALLSITTLLVL